MSASAFFRAGIAALALGFVFTTTACAGDSGASTAPEPAAPSAPAGDPDDAAETGDDGEDEYAFGTDRDEIAYSIEQAFTTQNGKARWEGDTLVLAIDGDAGGTLAGFTECRVLLELLKEDDASVIEFPNGQVACADVLGG